MLRNWVTGICVYAQKINRDVEVTSENIDTWQDWGSFELFITACLTSKGQAELILAFCSASEETTVVPAEDYTAVKSRLHSLYLLVSN